jgi:hypothetical protein
MDGTGSATGSFWLCLACRKHVPSRSDVCACGARRGETQRDMHPQPHDDDTRDEARSSSRILPIVGAVVTFCALSYVAIESQWQPAPGNTELARRLRERFVRRAPVVIPSRPPMPSVPREIEKPLARSLPAPTAEPPTLAPLAPSPEASVAESESEAEARRRIGTEEFENAMTAVAAKADEADVAWHGYVAGCRVELTSAQPVADREWLVYAYSPTTHWADACSDASTFRTLSTQVHDAMCAAEDHAQKNWVLPGVRRDLRHRFRVEWDGWDAACR